MKTNIETSSQPQQNYHMVLPQASPHRKPIFKKKYILVFFKIVINYAVLCGMYFHLIEATTLYM